MTVEKNDPVCPCLAYKAGIAHPPITITMASVTALPERILATLDDTLAFEDGDMDGLVTELTSIVQASVNEQTAALNERIAELEAELKAGLPNGKVKRTKGKGTAAKTGKKPNTYSRFVRWASEACKGDAAETGIAFTPCKLTVNKAISRWSAAPDDLVDFTAEYKLEDLIKIVKGHDSFSNLMIASSLVWNMIPPAAKEQVIATILA